MIYGFKRTACKHESLYLQTFARFLSLLRLDERFSFQLFHIQIGKSITIRFLSSFFHFHIFTITISQKLTCRYVHKAAPCLLRVLKILTGQLTVKT